MKAKINILAQTPVLLQELITEIPVAIRKQRLRPTKWSIHENACHITVVDDLFSKRFQVFKDMKYPVIKPYLPGKNVPDADLIDMDLEQQLSNFHETRKNLIDLIESLSPKDWKKIGKHDEYHHFSAPLMLRHLMMHDHFHMFRIQELWLTKQAYL